MHVLPIRTLDRPLAKVNFAGFDVIRAFAALGVVALHACVPYLQIPMPGLSWPVQDTPSSLVDIGFWTIELFIMPLFLVLAGFLAWQTLQRRGPGALVKNRAKRLLLPFLFGCLVILPIDLHLWVLGWVAEGLVEPIKMRSFKFDGVIDRNLWGTSHLWFLQYLFLYVLTFAAWHGARVRFPVVRRITASAVTIGMLCVALAAITLFIRPQVVWGFQHAFAPVPSKWIYNGLFFAAGLLIASRDPQLSQLQACTSRLIVPAVLLAIAAVTLGRWHLAGGENQLAAAVLAVVTAVAAAMVTFSIIGISVKNVQAVSTTVKYIAAASFWIYLVHHPILVLVHQDLKLLFPELGPIIKVVASSAMSVAVSLLTYEGLVRKTWFGQWLGFAWSMPVTPVQAIDSGSIQTLPLRFDQANARRAA